MGGADMPSKLTTDQRVLALEEIVADMHRVRLLASMAIGCGNADEACTLASAIEAIAGRVGLLAELVSIDAAGGKVSGTLHCASSTGWMFPPLLASALDALEPKAAKR
jgi:hypothetical protein